MLEIKKLFINIRIILALSQCSYTHIFINFYVSLFEFLINAVEVILYKRLKSFFIGIIWI